MRWTADRSMEGCDMAAGAMSALTCGKWRLACALVAVGAALVSQGFVTASTAAAAAGGKASLGDHCSPYTTYHGKNLRGDVRTCLAVKADHWEIVTHTRGQAYLSQGFYDEWLPVNRNHPATWKAWGTVRLSPSKSVSYSHGKSQTTWNGGDYTPQSGILTCGAYKVTRTYTQTGPRSDATFSSGEKTLTITVPCAY
ncbi:hypothetical protein ACFWNL_37260 [Kitasatospora sp. NPDC058397]|uniref:hypothetical protein n=1 Tax=unclassified Kitasatospora TaxID=2633591 RepID=UPI0036573D18